jgi:hypothetical protein
MNQLDGIGSTGVWGFSRALDLQNIDEQVMGETPRSETSPTNSNNGSLNILLLGSNDIRHVFKTMCRAWRHGKLKINVL